METALNEAWSGDEVKATVDLRDYFAGMALQGLLAANALRIKDETGTEAYFYADLMLKAREA